MPGAGLNLCPSRSCRSDKLWLAIAAEGTRTHGAQYKSGFYRIAKAVGVPVFPVYFNYRRKVIGLLPPIQPDLETAQGVEAIWQLLQQHGARKPGSTSKNEHAWSSFESNSRLVINSRFRT